MICLLLVPFKAGRAQSLPRFSHRQAVHLIGIAHGPVLESIHSPMFDPQPLHFRPLESRANLFAD